MILKKDTLCISVPYNESEWDAKMNYQGSLVTLFGHKEDSSSVYPSNLTVMMYPLNSLPMNKIYLNTVAELRKMLRNFSVNLIKIEEDSCVFEYEGDVQGLRMCFFQRIFRLNAICSVTGGCLTENAVKDIPRVKNIAEKVFILERSAE